VILDIFFDADLLAAVDIVLRIVILVVLDAGSTLSLAEGLRRIRELWVVRDCSMLAARFSTYERD